MEDDRKIIIDVDGVQVERRSDSEDQSMVTGKVDLYEKRGSSFIDWKQNPEVETIGNDLDQSASDLEWAVVDTTNSGHTVTFRASEQTLTKHQRKIHPIHIDIQELRSFKTSKPKNDKLALTFMLKDGSTLPAMYFPIDRLSDFYNVLKTYVHISQSDTVENLLLVSDNSLQKSLTELELFKDSKPIDPVSKFFNDPYTTAMGGFSKLSNFILDRVVTNPSSHYNNDDELTALLLQSLSFNNTTEGFELVTPISDLGPRPEVHRDPPLSPESWAAHVDVEGRVINVNQLLEKVFKGGVTHPLRCEVWKFLLGYNDYNLTYRERQEAKKQKVDDYYRMKLQWKSLSADQEKRFSSFRDRKNLIEKDVTRTDRTHPMFQGDNNDNVKMLQDILMTYCMYNFDLGYVQGMSDLLSPILVVMENEVDSFWCFVGFMDKIGLNFELDQHGMKTQLHCLNTLLNYVDRDFYQYLKRHESDNLYFCFRWLLILFKREFKFQDILRFWEVLWTKLPCSNFLLLFSLAVLDTEKNTLIENGFGFTEILKHINDMSQNIDLDSNLSKAEAIYLQLLNSHNVPSSVADILGLPVEVSDCFDDWVYP